MVVVVQRTVGGRRGGGGAIRTLAVGGRLHAVVVVQCSVRSSADAK